MTRMMFTSLIYNVLFLYHVVVLFGNKVTAIDDVWTKDKITKYLRTYGHLLDYPSDSNTPASDADYINGLRIFQSYNQLTPTGVANNKTLRLMEQPRCGCPDYKMRDLMGVEKRMAEFKPAEFNTVTKWNKNILKWTIIRYSRQHDSATIKYELERAFQTWQRVSNLRFQYEAQDSSDVDIKVAFYRGDHQDSYPFDGKGKVLGHAFYPESGRLHLDEDETWVINTDGTDVYTVATHEIGHSLGLGHSTNTEALMAPYYKGYDPNFELHSDDIGGIQALYGRAATPPTTNGRTTLPPPRPTTTVLPPSPSPTTDANCQVRFQTIMKDDNGDYLAFTNGDELLRLHPTNGLVEKIKSRDLFPNAPTRPDVAFNVRTIGTFMLRRFLVWAYARARGPGDARMLVANDYIQKAAFVFPERVLFAAAFTDNDIWLVGSYFAWKFNPHQNQISQYEYAETLLPGLPKSVDSAVALDSNSLYLFKDDSYWKYDRRRRLLTGPQKTASAFLGGVCGSSRKL